MTRTLENEKAPLAEVPSESIAQVPQFDIDGFLAMRKEFITKVNKIMVLGKDYHVIQGKKSLAKGGAEKIASIFGWTAEFHKDQEVALSFQIQDFIAFVCTLSKQGSKVGEGRGGALLGKNQGDPNKTIKMAQKSAFIDAVLRSSGLSDFFTQDLEDMPQERISNQITETTQGEANFASNSVSEVLRLLGNVTKPQQKYIESLAKQKNVSTEQLIELGNEKTASELIKALLAL